MSSGFGWRASARRWIAGIIHAVRPTAFRKRDLVDGLLIWALPTTVLAGWISLRLSEVAAAGPYPTALLAEEIVVMLVPMVAFPVWFVRRRDGWGAREFGLTLHVASPWTWAAAIGPGLAAGIVAARSMAPAPFLFLALSVWQPAVAEEILARGILQTKLARALGLGCGLLASAGLFAGMHLAGDLVGISFLGGTAVDLGTIGVGFVFRGAVGLSLGVIYLGARSLAPPILLHYLIDFGGAMFAWVM